MQKKVQTNSGGAQVTFHPERQSSRNNQIDKCGRN